MSQESACSYSTLPSQTSEEYDEDFLDELHKVDELYFAVNEQSSNNFDRDSDNDLSDTNYESDEDDHVFVEPSDSDNIEYITQNKFQNETCGCKEFYDGKPCSKVIDFDSGIEFREHCRELSREELDIVIKVELFSHRRTGSYTEAKKHKTKERERPYQEFFFNGKRICRATFCFIHGIGRKKLQAIAQSLDKDGLSARVHGSVGKPNKNALDLNDRERIRNFLCKYATDNALPLPGRLPNFKKSNVLLLPSDKTTAEIHNMYEIVAKDMKYRSISLRTFQRTWHDLCPHIVLAKPCTDLCQKCQDFAERISRSGNLSEEEKENLLKNYNEHISLAKEQRDFYRQQCQISRKNFLDFPTEQGNQPNSLQKEMHYSWDYAQQVHYPHHAMQVGPIYFRTPRKCNVFGICSEASGKQTFYLIDEAENPGKGANSVISMAHHFFQWYGYGETDGKIHFDNCQGQNKNNMVLWYGLWRVITGLHTTLQYSMMIVGHTKFDPDWHFGVWKLKWRNSSAESMNDIAETVQKSSRNGHNTPQLVNDPNKPVVFYDWKSYLQGFFKPIKNITKYHHFLFDSANPGEVKCQEKASSEVVTFNLLRNKQNLPQANQMPAVLPSAGLDAARQWYLFEQIREFCYSDNAKDLVCPKPTVPKKEVDLTKDNQLLKPVVSRKKALLN